MSTAPLWGALVGVLAVAPGLALWWLAGLFDTQTPATAMLVGVVSVGAYGLLTRGLHFDGLADTCDGFGSARTGTGALAVMKDPALGALGGLAMMLAVLLQAAAWGEILTRATATSAVVAGAAALLAARAPLMWVARVGTPAAEGGLGRAVVGDFRAVRAFAVGGCWMLIASGALVAAGVPVVMTIVVAVAVWGLAEAVRRSAIRRFEVVNGDVLGAIVEIGGTAALVLLALAGT
jgi:adenosylcobinamide-GDP ribazoletransferase